MVNDVGIKRINCIEIMIYSSGLQYWYQYGAIYRDNEKPAIILMVHNNGFKMVNL